MWRYNSLYHGDVSSDGRGIKSHKYVAKVMLANGKYRYFYDRKEYDAYLENQAKLALARTRRDQQNKNDKEWDDYLSKKQEQYQSLNNNSLFDKTMTIDATKKQKNVYKYESILGYGQPYTNNVISKRTYTLKSKGKITRSLEAASKTVSDLASKGKSLVDKLLGK